MKTISNYLIRERVAGELRQEILYGRFKFGEALYQDKIAQELGVSRMPVREAFQILANDGFITVLPNKIATVNDISEKFIRDYYDVRILLECEAIRLCCQSKIDCSEAWEYYNKVGDAIAMENSETFNHYNLEIHGFFWKNADNIKLQQLLKHWWYSMDVVHAPDSNRDHYKLIKYVEEGDADNAISAMKEHINRSCDRIFQRLMHNGKK